MKPWLIALLSIALGLALGLGRTWARFNHHTPIEVATPDGKRKLPPKPPASGPQPKVQVDSEEFVFGKIERGSVVEHKFRFTNAGGYPLVLENGGTSCGRCTLLDFKKQSVPPGGTVEVTVRYDADIDTPHFRQGATVLTNDPERPRVQLSIEGDIASTYHLLPDRITLSSVPVSESTPTSFLLLGTGEGVEVKSWELTDASTAEFFDVQLLTLTAEELSGKDAKSGIKVAITVKPGLPLGTFQQTIRLHTNLSTHPTLEVPIQGQVTSDITVAGQGWESNRSILHFGHVTSRTGIKRALLVVIHGPYRQDVKLEVESVTPSFLKVSLGEPASKNNGAVIHVPLEVEVPPGSPAANHLGSEQGKRGEVVLRTTHPLAKQMKFSVEFAVER